MMITKQNDEYFFKPIRPLQFSLSFLISLMIVSAIFFSRHLAAFSVVLLLQPILIWIVVTVLHFGIPRKILYASKNNCYRMDGSKSNRRVNAERVALREARINLYFVLYAVIAFGDLAYQVYDHFANTKQTEINPVAFGTIALELFAIWMIASCITIAMFYFAVIQLLYRGIEIRANEYMDADIKRVQRKFQHDLKEGSIPSQK